MTKKTKIVTVILLAGALVWVAFQGFTLASAIPRTPKCPEGTYFIEKAPDGTRICNTLFGN